MRKHHEIMSHRWDFPQYYNSAPHIDEGMAQKAHAMNIRRGLVECSDSPSGFITPRRMWSSTHAVQKTITSSLEHLSDAWVNKAHAQEGASVNRNMNFMERFIQQSNREGRESNAQSCTLGQHTLFDSYCAYPLRTPSLTESKHYAFDPFELLDGDSELLACLIQVQLAADEKRSNYSCIYSLLI